MLHCCPHSTGDIFYLQIDIDHACTAQAHAVTTSRQESPFFFLFSLYFCHAVSFSVSMNNNEIFVVQKETTWREEEQEEDGYTCKSAFIWDHWLQAYSLSDAQFSYFFRIPLQAELLLPPATPPTKATKPSTLSVPDAPSTSGNPPSYIVIAGVSESLPKKPCLSARGKGYSHRLNTTSLSDEECCRIRQGSPLMDLPIDAVMNILRYQWPVSGLEGIHNMHHLTFKRLPANLDSMCRYAAQALSTG